MLQIRFHPRVAKEILKIPKKIRLQILEKIAELEKLTHPLQYPKVKKLKGKKTENFRLRSGNYRIKFSLVNRETIKITHIQHRQVGY